MKRFSLFILLAATLLLTQCKNEPKQYTTEEALENFRLINGTWQMQPNVSSFETWENIEKGMLGRSFSVNDGDTVISAVYFFEPSGDSIKLEVQPIKDDGIGAPIPYILTSANNGIFTFENQNHNFPKEITYKIRDNEVEVILEGQIEDLQQQADYLLKKIPE